MTLELGRRSTRNSSQRDGWPGPSARSMRTATLASVIVARLGREDRVLEAFELLELHARALRRPGGQAVLEPLVVARLPCRHELRVVGRLGRLRPGQDEVGLVVRAPALVARARGFENDVRQPEHVANLLDLFPPLVDPSPPAAHV